MKQKSHSTEEVIRILRQADGGQTAQAVCREHNISAQTFYRWKKKYGGMELAESMLENRILKEVNAKKWCALRTRRRLSGM